MYVPQTALLYRMLLPALLLAACSPATRENRPVSAAPAPVLREFRAAWVATVANIDWPSEPGLSDSLQQREALAILDSAQSLNLNAIILQVRPQCDAIYPSELEPWTYYLSGEQGKGPATGYDPLAFWIEAAHDRGLELHAWFNPYRAHHPRGGEIGEASIVRRRPELVRKLPDGYYWLDPALSETQDHSFAVIMDVLRRYDIDGVHFDDYFYPYGDGNFPDSTAWEAYQQKGGKLSRADWRRDQVNRFIERVYRAIKQEKKFVKFGLSPFGIWRPGHPPSIRGFDQYNGLYADARLWLNQGWLDYWTPQLYWPTRQIPQSYPVLLGWWKEENLKGRHLWPGLYTSRIKTGRGADENLSQIMIARGFVPQAPGHVHFSMKALQQSYAGIADSLKQGPYRRQALVPPTPWLGDKNPAAPQVTTETTDDTLTVSWSHEHPETVFRWVLYTQTGDQWHYRIFDRNIRSHRIPLSETVTPPTPADSSATPPQPAVIRREISRIAVSAVDRLGNESAPAFEESNPRIE